MDDGGPAFGHGNLEQGGDPGMSLRDYFAGQALTGMLSHQITEHGNVLAGAAYEVADAMLEARKP